MIGSVRNVTANAHSVTVARARRLQTAFWAAWTVLFIVKIALATRLAPFGDEAWYWQESRALDWSYSDLPLATAWLIRIGETLLGHSTLAMRAPFLLLGALIPLLIVRMGTRVFGERAGWRAGLLIMALPLLATLGIFALPDVPLTVCSVLALDAFERCARGERKRDWIMLGLALAVAWLCHYRAGMLLACGLAFLILTARGRKLWSDSGLWLALLICCAGLVPLLVFNLQHDWVAFGFQVFQRNPWSFHADALVQPLEQAAVCTPLFYVLMLWAAWQCLRRARSGGPWDVLAVCAVVPIALYFVVGCFADDTRFRIHWPLPGYLPLLLAIPVLLEEYKARRPWRIAIGIAFATLMAGDVAAFAYLGAAAFPQGAAALASVKAFPEHFVGWDEAAQATQALLTQPRFADAQLVADNFMLAAELDFALNGTRSVFSLDHPLNFKHGRAPQLALWKRDEAGLRALGAQRVLVVIEPTARREREREAWLESLCGRIDGLEQVARLDLFGGRKRFLWFSGTVAIGASRQADGPSKCTALWEAGQALP
jgi:4-amino-4-deoxy-L-arabinose transferase-like glycosyltransferase